MTSGFAASVPTELPFIDEHATEVAAPAETAWDALIRIRAGFGGSGSELAARALGCEDTSAHGPVDRPGATLPGFRVVGADRPRRLALEGRHRFAHYALTFWVDELGAGRSRVRAETRAEFPGVKGRVYRALVIGTRGHVVAVRRVLDAVRRRAERDS